MLSLYGIGFFYIIMKIDNNTINQSLLLFLNHIQKHLPFLLPQYECMYYLGCRSIEALERDRWEFIEDSFLVLRTSKKNNQRIFKIDNVPNSFLEYLKNESLEHNFVTYQKLNYNFNKYFIYSRIYVGNKECRLHLFRHNYVKILISQGFSNEEIRDKLGEKHQSSADMYINSVFRTNPYDLVNTE